jgi:putative membrane protein
MKTLKTTLFTAAVALSLQACHSNKDSKATADSANKANDTSKMAPTDTSKNSSMTMTVGKDDADFAVNAANGGMAEVMLGKLAQDKATSPKLKEFAAMMVKDHSAAGDELMILAKSKNITLPAVVSTDKQKAFDDLNKKTGADFDKAYVKDMVAGHKSTVKLFEDAETSVKDPDLKAFIIKTLPTIKMHLGVISKIDSTMNK